MTDAERIDHWNEITKHYEDNNIQNLEFALKSPDPYHMNELFAQQGFKLGQTAQNVYHTIFKAWINGETSLDHVRYFFSHLGGGFYTTISKDKCVWSEIAHLERFGTIQPHTYNDFNKKFNNIRLLVNCLADEFKMPVNPQKTFTCPTGTARPLDIARTQPAWMLFYCMADYSRSLAVHFGQDPSSIPFLTMKDLEASFVRDEIKEYWLQSGMLTNSMAALPSMDQLAELMDHGASISRPLYSRRTP
jgi:hypothetical protein